VVPLDDFMIEELLAVAYYALASGLLREWRSL